MTVYLFQTSDIWYYLGTWWRGRFIFVWNAIKKCDNVTKSRPGSNTATVSRPELMPVLNACCSSVSTAFLYGHIRYGLKAPLHDTIRRHGACRLPCTWVNRNVWHVARMSRTHENRVKRNYSSFYFRSDSAARAVRLPNQSVADT